MKAAVVVIFLFAVGQSVKLPSNFHKCNRKDPEVRKCVLEAAQNAFGQLNKEFPEVHLTSLAPLEIPEISIKAGSQAVVNVDQHFKNCKLYGIDKVQLQDFEINLGEKYLDFAGVIAELKKVCEYELNGKILLLPIVGTGNSTISLNNPKITGRFDFEEIKNKGKTYIKLLNNKVTLEPESIHFNFENLFNGDKELGDNINKVLNENNLDVFNDVKSGYEEAIGIILQSAVNNFFEKVSIEELFD